MIRLQPSEGLRLQMTSKQPGPGGMRLFPSDLNLSFDELRLGLVGAAEELLPGGDLPNADRAAAVIEERGDSIHVRRRRR